MFDHLLAPIRNGTCCAIVPDATNTAAAQAERGVVHLSAEVIVGHLRYGLLCGRTGPALIRRRVAGVKVFHRHEEPVPGDAPGPGVHHESGGAGQLDLVVHLSR